MKLYAALGLCLATVALPAFAPAFAMAQDGPVADDTNPVIKRPAWVEPPSPSLDHYPTFASIIGLDGRVKVTCTVTIEGRPKNCAVDEAQPSGAGFDDWAIIMVEAARLTPAETAKGPVEAEISTNVTFSLMEPNAEPVWPGGPEPTEAQLASGFEAVRRWRGAGLTQDQIIDEGFGLEELTPHRRQEIRRWVRELFAPDYSDEGRAQSMARVLALRGLDRLPLAKPEDWETGWQPQLRAAAGLAFDREAALVELKRRYCAAFECRTQD